jgi:hypothetical protein
VKNLWLVTIPRIVLGSIFASAALSYFWAQVFGWPLLPVPISERGLIFALSIIRTGYLWPLMKFINLVAGILLIVNRAPAFALALLAPITVVIIWFQMFFNPLPIPLATVSVIVVCELLLLRAYAAHCAGMFQKQSVRKPQPL